MNPIRCLVLDVDGVLTDGRIYVGDDGRPTRAFDVHDGFAIRWFRRLGGEVVILTGKESQGVPARARELDIRHVIQASADKLADLQALLKQIGLTLAETAAIGDDLPDLPVLQRVALPVAVANAVPEVKAVARVVTQRKGGRGAVREALETLMRADGSWAKVMDHYVGQSGTIAGRQGNSQ